ncbi:hypothetical protein BB561_005082 [Smittium simulii]|uniref:Phospholipid/glycerol acyltransferase domain-containing protein n=1 Tax=Smittium simulii TaxID=133385 RepID=A0A2T9YCC7_9FUNG|nr:hypothetical protein BB561_005082 [Smittium simulii]
MQIERWFASVLSFVFITFTPHDLIITLDKDIQHGLQKSSKDGLYHVFPENESVVVMSNHQLYTDWVYAWLVAKLQRLDGNMKIILKDSLRKLPIFGHGMQFFEFIFLKRNWEADKKTLDTSLTRIKNKSLPTILFLFPEGTTLSKNGRAKSKSFCEKNNLADFKYLLYPRSTGMHYCISQLSPDIKYVYDLTMGYDGLPRDGTGWPEEIYSLKNMFYNSIYPKKVCIHIRRFEVTSIPKTLPEFSNWLTQRFHEKELMLETFYKESSFIPNSSTNLNSIKNPFKMHQIILEMVTIWLGAFSIYYIFKFLLFA